MKNSLKILTAIIFLLLAIAISNLVDSKDAKPKSTTDKNKSTGELLTTETDDDGEDDEEDEDNNDNDDAAITPKPKIKPAKKESSKKSKPNKKAKKTETKSLKNQKDEKNKKSTGLKGEKGEVGPTGPQGPKGEPGDAGSGSIPMQAAVSTVLTEHFGPAKDTIVPFDLVLMDLGDNYDNGTGVFICTIPGVYVVSLYLMSHPGAKVNARIYINSRPIAALWADDNKNVGFYPSSSIQTVTRLEFGDQVYVMLVDGGYGESWVHANYNAFTLYLLYEDSFMKK